MAKRWVSLYNWSTGQSLVVDGVKMRYGRMRKRIKSWCRIEGVDKLGKKELIMVMLTYRGVGNWRPYHISDFIKGIKQYCGCNLKSYAWVAEVQSRGEIHYHVLLHVKKGFKIPKPDRRKLWRYGHSGVSWARSPWYLLEYTSKKYQKDFSKFPKNAKAFEVAVGKSHRKELVFLSLKRWERYIVMQEGIESLRFYRKLHAELNKWEMVGVYQDQEDAVMRLDGFGVFSAFNGCAEIGGL
jgi:hypothetical protein